MDEARDLQQAILMIAERSLEIASACSNEESTKLYLILPVLGALGYDYTNPYEVRPEYPADLRGESANKVDFAIIRNDEPAIIVECKQVGANLESARGQLRAYFAALPSVKLGILADGLRFEFFVDSELPNIMDVEPFVTLDLEVVHRSGLKKEVLDGLLPLTALQLDVGLLTEAAQVRLVAKRIRAVLVDEVRFPSEELCRVLLQKVGLKHIRRSSIDSQYRPIVKASIEDAIVMPVLSMLRSQDGPASIDRSENSEEEQRIITTERELAILRYVRRRLAFLVRDEVHFKAIEGVHHRDYLGKLAVYYRSPRKGRLFDFIEGHDGFDKFIFPGSLGEIVTNNVCEIDDPLRSIFTLRVRELGVVGTHARNEERTA